MNRRTRALLALARRLPHPEPPTPRYLARMRLEPPAVLSKTVLGRWPAGVRARDLSVPGPVPLPCRVYLPSARTAVPRPLVVNFHGGGFVTGSLAGADWLCAQVAGRADAVVVSVGYRLAPEHPAPIPYQDCDAALTWLLAHADELAADPSRAAVLGASAGGNLAALVALAHRDRCRAELALPPLRCQVLIYPATDLTLSSASVTELADAPMLSRATLDWYGRRYLPSDATDPIDAADPRVSPLWADDHRDVAPALVIAAGRDPLRDDAVRYAETLRAAGVTCRLVVYPDALHGFVSLPFVFAVAREAVAETVTTLREAFAGAPPVQR